MPDRPYDALLLDLDGTLLDSRGEVHARNLESLRGLGASGVHVMVVTGRSKLATLPVLERLDLRTPAVVFNGAAVYCPLEDRLIEERTLAQTTFERLLAFGAETDDLTLVMVADRKLALRPRNEDEERSLLGLRGLELVEREELRVKYPIRVTFLSDRYEDSEIFASAVETAVDRPTYLTHFPLSVLPMHRSSGMDAVDVHPPCGGKAEALRVLEESYGVPPERVVAVGDATNDIPMLERAGLAVAMENSMTEVFGTVDRTIGHHDTDAIAGLVEDVFGVA